MIEEGNAHNNNYCRDKRKTIDRTKYKNVAIICSAIQNDERDEGIAENPLMPEEL